MKFNKARHARFCTRVVATLTVRKGDKGLSTPLTERVKGGDPALLLCVVESSSEVLHPDVESFLLGGDSAVEENAEEGHKNDPRDGAPPLSEQAEKIEATKKTLKTKIRNIQTGYRKRRAVKYCHRLPRDVVVTASLKTLKVRLDGALSSLI